MKSALLAGSAIATVVSGYADAADMAPVYKAPPAVAVRPLSWSGFYVGGHIGAGWLSKDWNNVAASSGGSFVGHLGSLSATGAIGGLQAGYNFQSANWVFGVETAWAWTDLNGSFVAADPNFGKASSRINWIGTLVGRAGMTFDRLLLYVGGGGAWTREKDDLAQIDPGSPGAAWHGSDTKFGWTVLAGVEYAIDQHWSARVQYNYYDFGTASLNLNATTPVDITFTPSFALDTPLQVHAVTVGVNYRFGGP